MLAKRRGPGRPPKPVDENQLFELGRIHCTYEEISAVLDISVDTLANKYSEIIKRGREDGKKSLRRKLFEMALEKGNLGAMIWLSKQHLGMSEKNETRASVTTNQPQTVIILPDNGRPPSEEPDAEND